MANFNAFILVLLVLTVVVAIAIQQVAAYPQDFIECQEYCGAERAEFEDGICNCYNDYDD